MKTTKLENGTLYENDGSLTEGIYDGTELVKLAPGESHLVLTRAAIEGDEAAVACYVANAFEKN